MRGSIFTVVICSLLILTSIYIVLMNLILVFVYKVSPFSEKAMIISVFSLVIIVCTTLLINALKGKKGGKS